MMCSGLLKDGSASNLIEYSDQVMVIVYLCSGSQTSVGKGGSVLFLYLSRVGEL